MIPCEKHTKNYNYFNVMEGFCKDDSELEKLSKP